MISQSGSRCLTNGAFHSEKPIANAMRERLTRHSIALRVAAMAFDMGSRGPAHLVKHPGYCVRAKNCGLEMRFA
jgi:hypothetical protein